MSDQHNYKEMKQAGTFERKRGGYSSTPAPLPVCPMLVQGRLQRLVPRMCRGDVGSLQVIYPVGLSVPGLHSDFQLTLCRVFFPVRETHSDAKLGHNVQRNRAQ